MTRTIKRGILDEIVFFNVGKASEIFIKQKLISSGKSIRVNVLGI